LFHVRQGSTLAPQKFAYSARRTRAKILIVGLQRQPARQPPQVAQIAKAVCGAANIHQVLEFLGAVIGCLPTSSATALLPSCRERLFERSYAFFESSDAHDHLQPNFHAAMPQVATDPAN